MADIVEFRPRAESTAGAGDTRTRNRPSPCERLIAAYDFVDFAETDLRLAPDDPSSGVAIVARAALMRLRDRTNVEVVTATCRGIIAEMVAGEPGWPGDWPTEGGAA